MAYKLMHLFVAEFEQTPLLMHQYVDGVEQARLLFHPDVPQRYYGDGGATGGGTYTPPSTGQIWPRGDAPHLA